MYRNIEYVKDIPAPLKNYNRLSTAQHQPAKIKACTIVTNLKAEKGEGDSHLSQPCEELSRLPIEKVFLILSRIQLRMRLRQRTLYLALETYLKYTRLAGQESEPMPEGCLILVCIYLAMKFE